MRIYHGSIEKVESPEIRESNRTLDYGQGFYTTTSYEQAEAWVRRRMNEKRAPRGYVCVYELDERALQNLNTHRLRLVVFLRTLLQGHVLIF